MSVHPGFARGALQKLAELQATEMDDWRDARARQDPPRAPARRARPLPARPAHAVLRHGGRDAALPDHPARGLEMARRRRAAPRVIATSPSGACEWIDRYGDLDGDGFQEYRTRSAAGLREHGLEGRGRRRRLSGRQPGTSQGAVRAQGTSSMPGCAWRRSSTRWASRRAAAELRRKAAELQRAVRGALLVRGHRLLRLRARPREGAHRDRSPPTPGICLWSGIAGPEHAARVVRALARARHVERLGHPHALGATIRPTTRSRTSAARCGRTTTASSRSASSATASPPRRRAVARDISEAASYFASYRLPELYAGVERQPGTFPVQYPQANVPQAWAAGCVFHLLQAILGLRADAPAGACTSIPSCRPGSRSSRCRARSRSRAVDLRFVREDERTVWSADVRDGAIDVREEAWGPWDPELVSAGQ